MKRSSGYSPLTLYDVAREAGTSKSTAARVLSKKGSVSATTAQAVLEAARRVGYETDEQAQRLVKGRYGNVVDIFASDLDYGNILRQIKILHHLLHREQSMDVSLHVSGHVENSDALMLRKLRRRRSAGMIVYVWGNLDQASIDELNRYVAEGGYLVCVNSDAPLPLDCDQVVFDQEASAYLATRYLLEHGHADIGYKSHGDENPRHPRILGIERAMKEFGLTLDPSRIFFGGLYEEGGVRFANDYLAMSDRPAALIINNDVSAAYFVHTVAKHGIRVPEDVSVVGLDGAPASIYSMTPLSTAFQPLWADAVVAVGYLMDRCRGGYTGPARIHISVGEIIERSSVKRVGCPTQPLQP